MIDSDTSFDFAIVQYMVEVIEEYEPVTKFQLVDEIYKIMNLSGELDTFNVFKLDISNSVDTYLHDFYARDGLVLHEFPGRMDEYERSNTFWEVYDDILNEYFVDPEFLKKGVADQCHICIGSNYNPEKNNLRYFDKQQTLIVCGTCHEELEYLLCFSQTNISTYIKTKYGYTDDYKLIIEYALKIKLWNI